MEEPNSPVAKPNYFPQDLPSIPKPPNTPIGAPLAPPVPPWMAQKEKEGIPVQTPPVNTFPSQNVTTPQMPVITGNKSSKKVLLIISAIVALIGLSLLVYFLLGQKKTVDQKTTITYWGLFEPKEAFQQVIADYEKLHPEIKIDYQYSKLTEYRERLQNSLKNNEGPDIFRMHQSWVPMLGESLSPVPGTVFDSQTFEKTFYPSAKESLKYQGQYVAIPLEVDTLALFYNEDLFKSAGKIPPKTWDELRKTAIELTVRDQQGKIRTAGVALGTTNNVDHWSDILGLMMLQNGADLSNPEICNEGEGLGGKVCPGADTLSYFTLFTRVDRSWDATLPSSTFAFATGNLAMYFGPSWRVFDIENFKRDYKSNVNYKIIPVPQLQGGDINWSTSWVEAVSKTSPRQAEAWEFLKYLSTKEVMQKLYQSEKSLRLFGEPFSRVDMADMLKTEPLVGSFIQQAPTAKNWYLSSNTNDNGINEQIIKYYEDAVNSANSGADQLTSLTTAGLGVKQVLRNYGLAR